MTPAPDPQLGAATGSTGDTGVDGGSVETAETGQGVPQTSWRVGAWQPCTVTCGPIEGEQTRSVTCVGEDNEPVNPELCDPDAAPDAIRACTAEAACVWVVDPFGPCDETCGEGIQSRTFRCEHPAGDEVSVSWCDSKTQPATIQACTETVDCAWSTGAYGPCDETCGNGTQTRPVTCSDEQGVDVDTSLCTGPPPSATLACFDTTDCAWSVGAWSACSATCADETGSRNRPVTCLDTAGGGVDGSWCPTPVPATSESCNGTTANQDWTVGSWTLCDQNCQQTRPVTCPSGCCSGPAPSSVQFCTDGLCFDDCDPFVLCP